MSKNKKLSDFVKSMDSAAVDSFLFTGDTSTAPSAGNFTVSPALPGGQTSWNVNTAGALEITEAGQWTFTAVDNGTISLEMKGAGGGYGRDTNAVGGTGGLTTGKINYSSGDTFVVTVGSKGTQQGTAGTYGGGGAGGALTSPGSGGGYSGIFTSSETQSNAILMAGGGGGSHGWDAGSAQGNGGEGGGSEGSAGTDGSAGSGGTQSAGGAGSGNGTSGSALTGGTGGNRGTNQGSGGGGGGGYYGGGGGAAGTYNGNQNGTSGGGGSGYIGGATGYTVTDGVTTAGSGSIVETDGTFSILAGSGGGSGRSSSARPLRTSDIANVDAPYDSATALALIDSSFLNAKLGSESFVDSDANAVMSNLNVNIIPKNRLTVGSPTKRWKNIVTNKISFGGVYIDTNGLDGGNATLSTFATPSDYSFTQPAIENIDVSSGGNLSFQGTRGHVAGGYAELGPVAANYFDITTPANAIDFGDLTFSRGPVAGFGDGTYAVYAGGANNINTPRNTIDYFTIASVSDATDFGDLTTARGWVGGASNGTYGLTAGGYNWATGGAGFDVIDYVTIASPSNATDFGDLSTGRTSRRGLTGHGDGTYAIFGGATDVIDYVTVDTPGNASDFGDLTSSRNDMGGSGANDATYAIYSGGGGSNVMDYITMATPGNATDFGDQSSTRNGAAGVSDGTYGVWCGGGNTNVMDYVTVTVPANAVDFGDLANGGYYKAGCSGSPS